MVSGTRCQTCTFCSSEQRRYSEDQEVSRKFLTDGKKDNDKKEEKKRKKKKKKKKMKKQEEKEKKKQKKKKINEKK